MNIEINEQYKKVFAALKTEKVVFATGQAGTGKSTLIDYIREQDPDIPVLAPTGVAALNVSGQTIHSFFKIPPYIINKSEITAQPKKQSMFKSLHTLIIDEVSMIRADIMDLIDISLRVNRNKDIPFGGVRMLLVGDMLQLPPIITSNEMEYIYHNYKTPYFMSAKCIEETKMEIIELTKVYRQHDPEFINLLGDIRTGNNIPNRISQLNNHVGNGYYKENTTVEKIKIFLPDVEYPEYIAEALNSPVTLVPDNATADNLNSINLAAIVRYTEFECAGVIEGNFDDRRLPAPLLLKLKVGTKVMFTRNDVYKKRWVNGTIGVVSYVSDYEVRVFVGYEEHIVRKETWESIQYAFNLLKNHIASKVVGSYTQYPLIHAWAITIHKSQGKTFDHVLINTGSGIFAEGQLYVALSRCRSLEGISLHSRINESDVKINPLIQNFYQYLAR